MKDLWKERYNESIKLVEGDYLDVLTGFNANIDVIYDVEDLDITFDDVEAKDLDEIHNYQDFKSLLKFCMDEGENKEVTKPDLDAVVFDEGEETVGGQGAIMGNYLSNINNSVLFYTPFLSEDLIEKMNDDILYPVMESQFMLKNIKDSSNTDRTKKNLIFEFSGSNTGRLILSDSLKGFGPYFRGGVEENFYKMDKNLDRVLLSGFHNIEGNMESKLDKSKEQLSSIDTLTHMEYVSMPDKTAHLIIEKLFSEIDSIGCDEFELRQLADFHDIKIEDNEEIKLLEAFKIAKKLLKEFNLSRFHLHTYRYHLIVTNKSYPVNNEKIRQSMLFGVMSAITMAEINKIPEENEIGQLNWENIHLKRLDELEEFKHYFELEDFVETGIAEVDGYNVISVPSLIHEEPKKLVGMGDIISAGSFVGELK